jgi:hypothetical protein
MTDKDNKPIEEIKKDDTTGSVDTTEIEKVEGNLEDLSVKELQDIAARENVPGVEAFKTRQQLVTLITTLRAMKATMASQPANIVSVGQDISFIPKISPRAEQNWEDKREKTRNALKNQPKVRIMVPLEIGEKRGAYQTVTINGCVFNLMKGVMVEVPEQIAKIIEESFQLTAEVGQELLLDREDPREPGHPVADKLS